MAQVSFAELDALAGEVLPERAVLSLIDLSGMKVNVLNSSSNSSYAMPAGNGHVAYACQATDSSGTPGVLGALGFGSANPGSSMTCIPAAVTR